MSDEHIRNLERVYASTQKWEDRVRLELARDRAGIGPGLLGSTVEHEFTASLDPSKRFEFQTPWTGFIRPGLYRVRVQSTLKFTRWMIGLDLENVSEWGRIEQTNGCLPRGSLWIQAESESKWMLRADTCANLAIKLGQVKELRDIGGGGFNFGDMWRTPEDVTTDTLKLTVERVSATGRAPQAQDVDFDFTKAKEAWLDITAAMEVTKQQMHRAMYVPRNFMGGGAGSSAGMREIMSDPDVAEGFECEPGVGE